LVEGAATGRAGGHVLDDADHVAGDVTHGGVAAGRRHPVVGAEHGEQLGETVVLVEHAGDDLGAAGQEWAGIGHGWFLPFGDCWVGGQFEWCPTKTFSSGSGVVSP